MAIGLGVALAIFAVMAAIFILLYVGEWPSLPHFFVVARDGMRAERARIDAERAKLGLPPFDWQREAAANIRRLGRILHHPIRERALIAESFRAMKNPATHKWSDGLS